MCGWPRLGIGPAECGGVGPIPAEAIAPLRDVRGGGRGSDVGAVEAEVVEAAAEAPCPGGGGAICRSGTGCGFDVGAVFSDKNGCCGRPAGAAAYGGFMIAG